MSYAETQDRQVNDGSRHFNQIRYTVGVIRIVIKLVITKGAKSESDQKEGKAEGGKLFCFSADFCHATFQVYPR